MSGYDALIASARVFAVRIQINQINKENRLMMARAAIMPFECRNKRDEFQWQQCGDVRARARTLAKHISKTQQLNTTQFYGIRYVSSLSCSAFMRPAFQPSDSHTYEFRFVVYLSLFLFLSPPFCLLTFLSAHTFVPRFLIEIWNGKKLSVGEEKTSHILHIYVCALKS